MKYKAFILLLFSFSVAFSQSKIDSLEKVLNNTTIDKDKIEILNELCIKYRRKSLDKSKEYGKQAVELSLEKGTDNQIYNSYSNYGKTFLYTGEYQKAKEQYQKSLEYAKKTKNDKDIAQAMHNIGNSNLYLTKYEKALSNYIQALKIREKIQDIEGIAATTNNIGNIYWNLKNNKKAIVYFKQSLAYEEKCKNKNGIATSLNNIGLSYWNDNKLDTALQYFNKSLRLKKEINMHPTKVAVTLGNIGLIYRKKGDYKKSLIFFNQSLEIAIKSNRKSDIANGYNNIAMVYLKTKEFDLAIENALKAKAFATKINSIRLLKEISGVLQVSYYNIKEYRKAYLTLGDYIMYKDTLMIFKNDKLMSEMESKYNTEKKEKEIKIQKLSIQKQKAENKSKTIILYIFIGIFILVIIFSIALLRQIKAKKRANSSLILKNAEITQQKEEIQAQAENLELANKKISQFNDKLVHQNDIIKQTNSAINSSIRYALTIQQALLPLKENYNRYSDNFIIYKPKDIVSGDFYWFSHVVTKEKTIYDFWIVVDCTGHGVPGAFMSMVGERLINEIINEQKIYSPKDILSELNIRVRKALKQKQNNNRDGMDVSLCRIKENAISNTIEICYAGAKRDLYVYRKSENRIETVKGTRKTIGGIVSRNKNIFIENNITVNPNDVVYLTSDGYIDQNNSNRIRFGTKKMLELLAQIGSKDLLTQKEILENTFIKYKENQVQRDDITIVGVKF